MENYRFGTGGTLYRTFSNSNDFYLASYVRTSILKVFDRVIICYSTLVLVGTVD